MLTASRPLRKAGAPVLGTYSHPNLVVDKYIATTGSDTTGDGSQGNPWATLGKAFTDASFPTNGWLSVRGGTYSNQNNGSVTGKIVNIVNHPGEAVTFDGTDAVGSTRLIAFGTGTAGTTVRGIKTVNYRPSITERAPIAFNEGGTIEYCHLYGNLTDPADGFTNLRFLLPSADSSMTIRHCTVIGSSREGIGGAGNGGIFGSLRMEYCDINDCCKNSLLTDFALTAAAIKYTNVLHADILHNRIYDIDGKGVWADVQSLDGLIYGNWISDCRGHAGTQGDGIFYEISGDGYIVNNWLHDNTRSGVQVSSGHRVYVAHNASFRNRSAFWLRDANRASFVFGSPAERYQYPSDVHSLNNLCGDFLPGGTATGNAFFRYENANSSPHDVGAVVGGADPYGPIVINANHYWQPTAGTPQHVSRLDLAAGGDNNNTTWANHQSDGFDTAGTISAVATNPFLRHEAVGDLRLPVGHAQQLAGVSLPASVATRLGIPAKQYSPGPLTPLAIY